MLMLIFLYVAAVYNPCKYIMDVILANEDIKLVIIAFISVTVDIILLILSNTIFILLYSIE